MKKKIIIPLVLCITGCLGETGKGYITKTCNKTENINGYPVETTIKITSKQGNIEKLTITETYDKNLDISSITNSKKSEQNSYINQEGIKLEINNNTFTYEIDKKEISEELKEKFNIKNEQHKQINYYEENGYKCK